MAVPKECPNCGNEDVPQSGNPIDLIHNTTQNYLFKKLSDKLFQCQVCGHWVHT